MLKCSVSSVCLRRVAIAMSLLLGLALIQVEVLAAAGRHALLVGITRYPPSASAIDLTGVPLDLISARKMAKAMGVDDSAISELKDQEATKTNILARLAQLRAKVLEGDRVFVYFSGHGTRVMTRNGCEEGFLTFDEQVINEQELAKFTSPISQRAEKVVVMIDACFSEGVVNPVRSLNQARPKLVAKFASRSVTPACDLQGVNNRAGSRSLLSELDRLGVRGENFVQIAAARRDEVSWDETDKGGVATQAFSQCLLSDAQDLNGSGAVSLDEVRACAQKFVDAKMAPLRDQGYLPNTIQVFGNRNLVVTPAITYKPPAQTVALVTPTPTPTPTPVAVKPPVTAPTPTTVTAPPVASPVVEAPTPITPSPVLTSPPPSAPVPQAVVDTPVAVTPPPTVTSTPVKPSPPTAVPPAPPASPKPPIANKPPASPKPPIQVVTAPPPTQAQIALAQQMDIPAPPPNVIGPYATMTDIFQQRDPRRALRVSMPRSELRIGQDPVAMNIQSAIDGYVYVVMLGSDEKSFYLLFPNKIDTNNRIKANQTLKLPRESWNITAAGPEGVNRVLVVVSQSARDPKIFVPEGAGGGDFTYAVADLQSRRRLVDFFVGRGVQGRSSAMAAALIDLKEIR